MEMETFCLTAWSIRNFKEFKHVQKTRSSFKKKFQRIQTLEAAVVPSVGLIYSSRFRTRARPRLPHSRSAVQLPLPFASYAARTDRPPIGSFPENI